MEIDLIKSIVIAIYIAFWTIATQIALGLLIKEIIIKVMNKYGKQKTNNTTK